MSLDAVVVGAGLSGLVAARALVRAGLTISVLEARERVGGRTESVELGGQMVDLGGQWLGARHARPAALAEELRVETIAQHVDGAKILERAGRRATFGGFFPRIPLVDLVELGYRMWSLDRLARRVPLDDPAGARRARASGTRSASRTGWSARSDILAALDRNEARESGVSSSSPPGRSRPVGTRSSRPG